MEKTKVKFSNGAVIFLATHFYAAVASFELKEDHTVQQSRRYGPNDKDVFYKGKKIATIFF